MAFPTGTISASDIRSELAYNNTAGAQTNVSLNDTPVRAAANIPSGTVSYNNLRGVNVMWSGTLTFGRYSNFYYTSPPLTQQTLWETGYNSFGGLPGSSLSTTSYYRKVKGTNPPSSVPNLELQTFYNYTNTQGESTTFISWGYQSLIGSPSYSTLYVYMGGTRYTLSVTSIYSQSTFQISGDPMNLYNRNGQTHQIVIMV